MSRVLRITAWIFASLCVGLGIAEIALRATLDELAGAGARLPAGWLPPERVSGAPHSKPR